MSMGSGNTGCPTRYRTRHLFNNFTTNEDIATKFEADLPHCVRNVKEKNVLLFKFRCNIFIGVRIIKEMPGSVASGTPCNYRYMFSHVHGKTLTKKLWQVVRRMIRLMRGVSGRLHTRLRTEELKKLSLFIKYFRTTNSKIINPYPAKVEKMVSS